MQRFSRVSFRKIALVLVILLTGFYLANYSGFLRSSSSPGLQVKDPYNDQLTATNFKRRQAVREATKHAWSAYKQFAWGRDELRPISGNYSTGWGGWAITLVDSLDTLKLMNLDEDYEEAKDFVRTMQFDRTTEGFKTPVFEMTIRALGGLLGAYELDNDPMLLKQAKQVADSLSYAFNTTTGLPATHVDVNGKIPLPTDEICIAEAGTLQLEFKKLSQLTGDDKYTKLVENVSEILERAEKRHEGLYYSFINIHTGEFYLNSSLSVGAYADSFYEYLLKQYILHDGKELKFKERYIKSVEAINSKLVRKSYFGFSFIDTLYYSGTTFSHTLQHLACFYPGLLALGSKVLDRPQDLELAKELARTCYHSYNMTPTGLGPEWTIFRAAPASANSGNNSEHWWVEEPHFDAYGVGASHPQYVLRPETVETLFTLYRVTGDTKYQEWGWNIFQAIEKYAKLEHGYAGVKDVYKTDSVGNHYDSMQSFLLSETFKYLYLLFGPTDLMPLDEVVFNTEAHALRIIK
ncbi:hypothetical protein GGI02_000319 [Coemansia sp. RSA 2322]|nr:hypothetical protein GGI02_000319 [Coemansia sp. RSA 2322]